LSACEGEEGDDIGKAWSEVRGSISAKYEMREKKNEKN
jgi:hypothetical protein